jgi:hypothetical protein
MLRHIISVSLAMTACATLIPTKANAVSLTLLPVGSLQRNPGDSIEFTLAFNPSAPNSTNGTVGIINVVTPPGFDGNELSFDPDRSSSKALYTISNTTNIANFFFNVLSPVKDGKSDVFQVVVNYVYQDDTSFSGFTTAQVTLNNETYDVEPVPEPLTIFGTATALGCGVLFKRKSSKKTLA